MWIYSYQYWGFLLCSCNAKVKSEYVLLEEFAWETILPEEKTDKDTVIETIIEEAKTEESYTITELSEGDEFIVNGVTVKAEMRK